MRQRLLGALIYEAFPWAAPSSRPGAPVLGLWEGVKDAGGWAAAVARERPTLGRLFIITELSAKPRAGTTHEPGMSLWSTHPTGGWPLWCPARGPAQAVCPTHNPLPPGGSWCHPQRGSSLRLFSQALSRALTPG